MSIKLISATEKLLNQLAHLVIKVESRDDVHPSQRCKLCGNISGIIYRMRCHLLYIVKQVSTSSASFSGYHPI